MKNVLAKCGMNSERPRESMVQYMSRPATTTTSKIYTQSVTRVETFGGRATSDRRRRGPTIRQSTGWYSARTTCMESKSWRSPSAKLRRPIFTRSENHDLQLHKRIPYDDHYRFFPTPTKRSNSLHRQT